LAFARITCDILHMLKLRRVFYEDKYQFRNTYYSGVPTPRNFSTSRHAENHIYPGMQWLGARR